MNTDTGNSEVINITMPGDRAWFDGFLLNVASTIVVKDVPLAGPSKTPIVPADTKRYMLGLIIKSGGGTVTVAPWPDPDSYSLTNFGFANPISWFKLFDYGPLICNAWYNGNTAGTTLRVIDIGRI